MKEIEIELSKIQLLSKYIPSKTIKKGLLQNIFQIFIKITII